MPLKMQSSLGDMPETVKYVASEMKVWIIPIRDQLHKRINMRFERIVIRINRDIELMYHSSAAAKRLFASHY